MPDTHGRTRILVVDDERLIRLTLSAKLKTLGYIPVAVGTVDEAVAVLQEQHGGFRAILTDIMMGTMDGFKFRSIVRDIDPSMPIFFLTALDPEEGSGFLKKILEDPISYYLPKSTDTDVLLKRVQNIVASRRIEQFIERQMANQRKALSLAAQVQRSMLPLRTILTPRGMYTTLWKPNDIVSGDLYEAIPFGFGCYLYVLGDIQGHGTSAALAMTAVQSFLKQLAHREGMPLMEPHDIANLLQKFFRDNLVDVSYMTALICIHRPLSGDVVWLSCGAPDIIVIDPEDPNRKPVNPEHRGGVPIGLFPDTEYTAGDVVTTPLSRTAVCVCFTDGIFDLARDKEGIEKLPEETLRQTCKELVCEGRSRCALIPVPYKLMSALSALGYKENPDDATILMFGARLFLDGVFQAAVPLNPASVDDVAQSLGEWCEARGWDVDLVARVQLVLEEKLMNIHDHGFDDRERLHEAVGVRVELVRDNVEMTIWDCGTQEPSIEVAAGSSDIAFELVNRKFSGRGRGRLMVREICNGIERSSYAGMNETVYYVPVTR